jgi:hypothetical protein
MQKSCSVEGCTNTTRVRRGLCQAHYTRMWRNGHLELTRAPSGAPMAFLEANIGFDGQECLKWPYGEYVRGYGQISFRGRPQYAHRVMCILAHGEPEPDQQALHSCGKGNEGCVNPNHLYWGTALDNARDAINHGSFPCGEKSAHAKLTEREVIEIRSLAGSVKQSVIAERFGIQQQHVSQIQTRKRWKHLP